MRSSPSPGGETSGGLDQRFDERGAGTPAVFGRTAQLRQLVALLGGRHRSRDLVGAEGQRQRRAFDVENPEIGVSFAEAVVLAELDSARVAEVRGALPANANRRMH